MRRTLIDPVSKTPHEFYRTMVGNFNGDVELYRKNRMMLNVWVRHHQQYGYRVLHASSVASGLDPTTQEAAFVAEVSVAARTGAAAEVLSAGTRAGGLDQARVLAGILEDLFAAQAEAGRTHTDPDPDKDPSQAHAWFRFGIGLATGASFQTAMGALLFLAALHRTRALLPPAQYDEMLHHVPHLNLMASSAWAKVRTAVVGGLGEQGLQAGVFAAAEYEEEEVTIQHLLQLAKDTAAEEEDPSSVPLFMRLAHNFSHPGLLQRHLNTNMLPAYVVQILKQVPVPRLRNEGLMQVQAGLLAAIQACRDAGLQHALVDEEDDAHTPAWLLLARRILRVSCGRSQSTPTLDLLYPRGVDVDMEYAVELLDPRSVKAAQYSPAWKAACLWALDWNPATQQFKRPLPGTRVLHEDLGQLLTALVDPADPEAAIHAMVRETLALDAGPWQPLRHRAQYFGVLLFTWSLHCRDRGQGGQARIVSRALAAAPPQPWLSVLRSPLVTNLRWVPAGAGESFRNVNVDTLGSVCTLIQAAFFPEGTFVLGPVRRAQFLDGVLLHVFGFCAERFSRLLDTAAPTLVADPAPQPQLESLGRAVLASLRLFASPDRQNGEYYLLMLLGGLAPMMVPDPANVRLVRAALAAMNVGGQDERYGAISERVVRRLEATSDRWSDARSAFVALVLGNTRAPGPPLGPPPGPVHADQV
jgi:hypothetical protein